MDWDELETSLRLSLARPRSMLRRLFYYVHTSYFPADSTASINGLLAQVIRLSVFGVSHLYHLVVRQPMSAREAEITPSRFRLQPQDSGIVRPSISSPSHQIGEHLHLLHICRKTFLPMRTKSRLYVAYCSM
jgi:hypothetical protein